MPLDLGLAIPEILASVAPRIDARMEALLPRSFDEATLVRLFGSPRYDFDQGSLTEALSRPIWHCLDAGGKRWRPALMLVAASALGADPDALWDLAAMCELIHNGTLVIDDIEDDSPRRRGRDAAHLAFGHDIAVNAGNALYFVPLEAALAGAPGWPAPTRLAVRQIVNQEMARLHCGQAMDIAWHRAYRLPTVAQYLQMCALKTGTLARMAVRVAAAASEATGEVSAALGQYAETIGVAFQIQDDILNVTPSALAEGKGLGEDIHEGKITLLVIHALAHTGQADHDRLLAILRAHTCDASRIREAVDMIASAGSIEFARDKACGLIQEAWAAVRDVLAPSAATDKLREFGEFLTSRDL